MHHPLHGQDSTSAARWRDHRPPLRRRARNALQRQLCGFTRRSARLRRGRKWGCAAVWPYEGEAGGRAAAEGEGARSPRQEGEGASHQDQDLRQGAAREGARGPRAGEGDRVRRRRRSRAGQRNDGGPGDRGPVRSRCGYCRLRTRIQVWHPRDSSAGLSMGSRFVLPGMDGLKEDPG